MKVRKPRWNWSIGRSTIERARVVHTTNEPTMTASNTKMSTISARRTRSNSMVDRRSRTVPSRGIVASNVITEQDKSNVTFLTVTATNLPMVLATTTKVDPRERGVGPSRHRRSRTAPSIVARCTGIVGVIRRVSGVRRTWRTNPRWRRRSPRSTRRRYQPYCSVPVRVTSCHRARERWALRSGRLDATRWGPRPLQDGFLVLTGRKWP